jgi:hypothetical protein
VKTDQRDHANAAVHVDPVQRGRCMFEQRDIPERAEQAREIDKNRAATRQAATAAKTERCADMVDCAN